MTQLFCRALIPRIVAPVITATLILMVASCVLDTRASGSYQAGTSGPAYVGESLVRPSTLNPPPQDNISIPPSFFAVTMIGARHYPGSQFLFGALGHPTTFIWGWLEPEPKAYRWSVTDSYVQQAIDHHLPVMLTMGKTPEWAAADRGTCKPHERCSVLRP
jgi:hypothetical protein